MDMTNLLLTHESGVEMYSSKVDSDEGMEDDTDNLNWRPFCGFQTRTGQPEFEFKSRDVSHVASESCLF